MMPGLILSAHNRNCKSWHSGHSKASVQESGQSQCRRCRQPTLGWMYVCICILCMLQLEACCVMSGKVPPPATAAHTPLLCEHLYPFMSLKPCLKLIMHGARPPEASSPYARTCRKKHGSHRFDSPSQKPTWLHMYGTRLINRIPCQSCASRIVESAGRLASSQEDCARKGCCVHDIMTEHV
jgi:hypothetical protein